MRLLKHTPVAAAVRSYDPFGGLLGDLLWWKMASGKVKMARPSAMRLGMHGQALYRADKCTGGRPPAAAYHFRAGVLDHGFFWTDLFNSELQRTSQTTGASERGKENTSGTVQITQTSRTKQNQGYLVAHAPCKPNLSQQQDRADRGDRGTRSVSAVALEGS